ncbi:MAG: NAD(P)/FAD-dependent oxidoreductase [Candidatus Cloacimonetes bacterium]|jgi:sulfide:quinone oxidoreductase|nr:NAD(P)/FAD-dependent oxidoreductase [Candidatus Cloacimonadota bacterium]MBT4332146.1 NAD(P)/FAD-dependent oxidoreductase [Candidatus Cloacimonadota bacterium]MBT4575269.1 NAD(P)/FAD-dependent oxidoreductase [Candidatus Cloacimonadota bacterium]
MKKLLILGAGTAGTMMVNHLNRKLNKNEWKITVVDQHKTHYYQPGFLFIPFDTYTEKDVIKTKKQFIPKSVEYIEKAIEVIEHDKNNVVLKDGTNLSYDILIIATGSKIVPDEVDGLADEGWHKNVFDFYTIEGATALRDKLKTWEGGKFIVHLTEMPIKCPVAPLEFIMLADAFFHKKGIREKVEMTYITPLSGAFTKQNCSNVLGYLLDDKKINMVSDFDVELVNEQENFIQSYDEKKVNYDLLVTIPTNMGDDVIERSGLGDDLNFVPTHKHTLQSKKKENIFVIGDATDLPSSKAGSVAHFQAEVLTKNIMKFINEKELVQEFDGHANCFIESGFGKAFLIDFNYDVEPVEGTFPLPLVGPFSLLKETRINHIGKLAFKYIYWNMLLKGLPMPGITTQMSKLGKKI